MNHRDVWFVGLLALAYLYLDAAAPAARRTSGVLAQPLRPLPDEIPVEPFGFPAIDGCPRDDSHPVSRRDDGAKWCLRCDEAFYPVPI
jgi:hypothetical protein